MGASRIVGMARKRTAAVPDFVPRYHTIEQSLRARVERAEPHAALPSEAELSAEFGVSRMTARAAILRLVADGLVYREKGRGTFVSGAARYRQADTLLSFSDEVRRQGRHPSSRLVSAGLRSASTEEVAKLRLAEDARVVALRRLRLADEVPVALEHAVFPDRFEAVLNSDLERDSLHAALSRLGGTPTFGRSSVHAMPATAEDMRLLGVERHTALLVEDRLILDQAGDPLELTESRYVGGRYALSVSFDVHAPSTD